MIIAKIHRQYSWDVRGWCRDKKKGIYHSVDPFEEKKNQHRTLHLDPQHAGFMVKPNVTRSELEFDLSNFV